MVYSWPRCAVAATACPAQSAASSDSLDTSACTRRMARNASASRSDAETVTEAVTPLAKYSSSVVMSRHCVVAFRACEAAKMRWMLRAAKLIATAARGVIRAAAAHAARRCSAALCSASP